jgi:Tfp pilus assembly protein PilN
VRAVDLIPGDLRRAGGAGGRSGGGAYVLLGVLAALVGFVALYVLTANSVTARERELTEMRTQATAAQQQADRLRPYRTFAALAQARVSTVRQLGAARFDWHRAFAELSRVIPEDVWLTSLLGTVTTGVTVDGGGSGDTSAIRSALPNPAIELTGCTSTQTGVARLISRLRLLDGVVRVSLSSSAKPDESGAGAGDAVSGAGSEASAGGDKSDCRGGRDIPEFGLVVFFEPLPAVPAPPSAGAAPSAGADGGVGGADASATAGAPGDTAPAPAAGVQVPASNPAGGTGASGTEAGDAEAGGGTAGGTGPSATGAGGAVPGAGMAGGTGSAGPSDAAAGAR